ncbi:GNAT family acetyltransferase [Colletotrichum musicola]|uniref:GNAT family acetyltransferase n=1 Tax=Colletotrichum musicola TaxID=2175873 RepID=A0A8H6N503_9PEZI|nr:GNAT family acetyltransferase [Colletotrichum musicola]
MSLPQTTTMKTTQTSIKSFFQPRQQPSFAPPPASTKFTPAPGAAPPPPPPPPATTTATETTAAESPADTPPPASKSPSPTSTSTPPPLAPITLHPQASIRRLDDADLSPLRRINALLLPVTYPETFYAAALTGPFSRVITWTDPATSKTKVVGGVVSRVEPSPFPPSSPFASGPEHALYIQSLALLEPYRCHGLAAAAIDNLVSAAAATPGVNLRYVYAHVWTDNEEGLRWYNARRFRRFGNELKGYYIKLRPDTAYIMRRAVGPLGLGATLAPQKQQQQQSAPPPNVSGLTAAVANMQPMNGSSPSPSPSPSTAAPPPLPGQSFQNRRAETEWNDLPADMAPGMLVPPKSSNGGGSAASSRSSSTARKKKDRAYPAAAFS